MSAPEFGAALQFGVAFVPVPVYLLGKGVGVSSK